MRTKITFVLLSVIIIMTGSCQSKKEKLEKTIQEFALSSGFNGFVHISYKENILYHKEISNQNISFKDVNSDTRIYMASLSKLFTQLAIINLVEQGSIHLDSTISFYRQNFKPGFGRTLTIRNLLTMSSGLPRELL